MDEEKKQELIDTFKKEGIKACIKQVGKKKDHPEEVSFCEKLWLDGLVTEYTRDESI